MLVSKIDALCFLLFGVLTTFLKAHRYMVHHSKLDGSKGDKLIIGVSKLEHIKANAEACIAGPLPNEIIEAFDEGATITQPYWYDYFR